MCLSNQMTSWRHITTWHYDGHYFIKRINLISQILNSRDNNIILAAHGQTAQQYQSMYKCFHMISGAVTIVSDPTKILTHWLVTGSRHTSANQSISTYIFCAVLYNSKPILAACLQHISNRNFVQLTSLGSNKQGTYFLFLIFPWFLKKKKSNSLTFPWL